MKRTYICKNCGKRFIDDHPWACPFCDSARIRVSQYERDVDTWTDDFSFDDLYLGHQMGFFDDII